ncbi:xanthine dehydrogenase accessory protein XdhC [Nocardioides sp. CER19]|uniref:xanthine dehydrogenase accessory protein XdhC n=1 Tax=Nocardioides sp. CER19 TaxID=3038538 RepID=UPI002448E4B6|nr:xanthine dehydrogenase accessory protein XdhC [Nocardioides sp. CER19]MDH2413069.1 xanthine dehydrogenase accessory protein XdhC [Nocardioides sp. CER19]
MTAWIEAVRTLRTAREAGVLVTLIEVRGHAPREAGAKMVVSASRTWSSIGGGNLEEDAIARARALIEIGAVEPASFTASLSDKAPPEYGVQCCGGEVTVLLEPLRVVPSVAIFGMGHVGVELARILARHDIELHLVDSRDTRLDAEVLVPLEDAVAGVHRHHVPVIPELVLAELPHGTQVLVLTHDHAEDLAIIDAALRCPHLGSVGLIGSSAKWARFRAKLAAAGFSAHEIDRVQTPIGLPGLTTSKEPAAIALSVAAAWLASREWVSADAARAADET